jgi:hypothetical protein
MTMPTRSHGTHEVWAARRQSGDLLAERTSDVQRSRRFTRAASWLTRLEPAEVVLGSDPAPVPVVSTFSWRSLHTMGTGGGAIVAPCNRPCQKRPFPAVQNMKASSAKTGRTSQANRAATHEGRRDILWCARRQCASGASGVDRQRGESAVLKCSSTTLQSGFGRNTVGREHHRAHQDPSGATDRPRRTVASGVVGNDRSTSGAIANARGAGLTDFGRWPQASGMLRTTKSVPRPLTDLRRKS